jgi:hypothetical protein
MLDGSRWLHEKPSTEEVNQWFLDNVLVHDQMQAADWVGGLTLIETKETVGDEKIPVWAPYVKVETRLAYFHELMTKRPDQLGVIEPVEVPKLKDTGYYNLQLPEGFFYTPVQEDDQTVRFLCCSMRVTLFEREGIKWTRRANGRAVPSGTVVEQFPAGTKAVNVLCRWGADENALMKAETGAVGRALAMAGILVIPGTALASAEDVAEAVENEGHTPRGTVDKDHTEAAAEQSEAELKQKLKTELGRLKERAPNRHARIQQWAKSRKIDSLDSLSGAVLKGTLKKVAGEVVAAEEQGDIATITVAPSKPEQTSEEA